MKTLRLKNYRCFEDTGDINLKPLTLLVGANSSGKSSFLKFFPLLKQSIGIRKNGVFLWYSDDVDFKDFKNTVRNGEGSIIIDMELPLVDSLDGENSKITKFFKKKGLRTNGAITKFELTISEIDENTDYLEHLSISYYDQQIDISLSKEGEASICVNGDDSIISDTVCKIFYYLGAFLPQISLSKNDANFYIGSNVIRDKIIAYLDSCNANMNFPVNESFSRTLYFLDKDFSKEYFSSFFNKREKKSVDLDKLNNLYLLYNLNTIIDFANSFIHDIAMNISYVKPLRVMPERYYRYQNYSVDEISSDGKNLAMYFANLKKEELKNFQKWTISNFGFKLEPHKLEGHVGIDIIEEGKTGRNMVDIGFGYNQLLPILAIIWNAINNKRRVFYSYSNQDIKFIVIEQPELHLHPRILAMFAEMLGTVISNLKEDEDVRFIIETHSETIINKIGSLIYSEKLDRNKVNVVLFNAQNEGLPKYVEQASFDSKGYLNNWPTGFFL